tara:strand:+ start:1982 stop:3049 length:1068 start_codon:yes stop_codon:yes gene_type:complete
MNVTKKNFLIFLKNCKSLKKTKFYKKLDKKHSNLNFKTKNLINKDLDKFLKNFRDSDLHDDLGCPPQITAKHIKINGFFKSTKDYLLKLLNKLYTGNYSESFFYDMDLIYKIGGKKLAEKNPVHLTPMCKTFFFKRKTSFNLRWIRYLYFSTRILNEKLLKPNNTWVDIGSYYGGLQSIIKKEIPNCKIILVDFDYQLCKSYLFLKEIFPKTNHILPDQLTKKKINDIQKDSIIYLPVEKFNLINLNRVNLITNFFSFGEMTKKHFYDYYIKMQINRPNYVYMCNRFVSSPWFEKTYDSNMNILNYLSNKFKIIYFDILPLHINLQSIIKINGRIKKRAASSNYFEMIMKKNEKK